MSFMRCMSPGLMFCMPSDIWSTICCISCSRSLSIICSKRCCASRDSKSYALELADLAGEIVRHEIESHVALGSGVASGR